MPSRPASVAGDQGAQHRNFVAELCGADFLGSFVRSSPAALESEAHGPEWVVQKQDHAQLFSAESGTACAAAWKPIFEWVPSQNGFLVDAPQRQSTVLS